MLDVEAIRADVPILHTQVHGKPLVYLDNGASAQKPRQVIEKIRETYEAGYANVHRGLHHLSNAATDAYEHARAVVREFINAASLDEVIFTKGTTEAINLVAHSWGMPNIGEGDEIVLTIAEHHSNIVPWHLIRERQGAKLVWVDVEEDGSFSLEKFEAAITERTKLIACVHMSNVTGSVAPVAEICEMARERGIATLVDGSQSAVHMPVDVQAIGCDFFCFTGHKTYGPSGIGVLWGRRELLAGMRPFHGGGEMILDVTKDGVTYNEPPHRFEAGTPPIVQAIGLGRALEWMMEIGRDAIVAHENELRDYARAELGKVNALRMIGDAPDKGAIFSFEIEGVHAHDISMVIDRSGVAVRAGTHCAQPLMQRFGVTSTCRASFAIYSTKAEVDALVAALDKARKFFG